jgi:membrane protein CcdC involved in cytochrome C biogenesis
MTEKWFVKSKGIINSVIIIIIRVFTIVNFHVVLEENEAYPMILIRFWLIKSHARYMIIEAHFN